MDMIIDKETRVKAERKALEIIKKMDPALRILTQYDLFSELDYPNGLLHVSLRLGDTMQPLIIQGECISEELELLMYMYHRGVQAAYDEVEAAKPKPGVKRWPGGK